MAYSMKTDFQYYLDNQQLLVKKYAGKYIVIKDCKILGAFTDEAEAIETTQKDHALGTFMVQKCESGQRNYTQTFHSRVAFS